MRPANQILGFGRRKTFWDVVNTDLLDCGTVDKYRESHIIGRREDDSIVPSCSGERFAI